MVLKTVETEVLPAPAMVMVDAGRYEVWSEPDMYTVDASRVFVTSEPEMYTVEPGADSVKVEYSTTVEAAQVEL